MVETTDDRSSEKRRRILDAARFLMLRNGLRGTTMEAIARDAHIAKPTLYAHFPDKDAVFVGILDSLIDDLVAAYHSGMQGDGDVSERIGTALAGQYGVLARTLAGSPHAAELMSEHKRGGLRFRAKDMQAETEIAAELRAAGVAEPEALTRVIVSAAYGIAFKIDDEGTMMAAIKLMCRRLIEPAVT